MMDSPRLRGAARRRFVRPMASLREIASAHAPLLVLDAASALVQVGWVESAGQVFLPDVGSAKVGDAPCRARWESSTDEAGIALFRCIEKLGVNPTAARAFVFCDGPGSILGVRTAAMAIRTWQVLSPRPIFAYSSLALVAHALGRAEVGVIADARRESWHHFQLGHTLQRRATTELSGGLVMPEHFRHWSALPANVTRTPYELADLLPRVVDADLLRATDSPDAFLHEEPNYVTWTPQVHRAP